MARFIPEPTYGVLVKSETIMVARSTNRLRDYIGKRAWDVWGVHVIAVVGVVMTGWSWSGLALALAFYFGRMFFITAGYHRYFAHRSFKTSRAVQFLLGLFGTTAVQKGPLWWAGHHRTHHKYSDLPGDIHSAKNDGIFWSHIGWIVVRDYKKTDESLIRDMAKFPELRWLNKHYLVAPIALAVLLLALGGFHALVWGFFVSTVMLWHGTFTINSLSHVFGRKRYVTTDESRNNWFLAIITMGEGWHNNHHHYMSSANQGFFWWELDVTYMILKALSWTGLVWDLRKPPGHVLASHRYDATVSDDSLASEKLRDAA